MVAHLRLRLQPTHHLSDLILSMHQLPGIHILQENRTNSTKSRRDYRRTTSASQLISELGGQSLAERRKTCRLTLLYKAINGLVAIPIDELEHTSICTRNCGPDAFIILQSRVDAYKFSFFPRTVTDWNSLPSSARSTPSVNSFKTALHSLSGVINSHH